VAVAVVMVRAAAIRSPNLTDFERGSADFRPTERSGLVGITPLAPPLRGEARNVRPVQGHRRRLYWKSNNYEPKVQFYKNIARGMQLDRPEALQYSVVSVANLGPREADWFRHGWLDEYRSRLKKTAAEFGAICVGLPLATALTGFLAFWAGRWIWAGFDPRLRRSCQLPQPGTDPD
jgi:hypothetical protein